MPRYLFRVPLKGGRRNSDNIKMFSTYKSGALENVIYNCGTEAKAKKLAVKQNGAAWLLGILDENDILIPPLHLKDLEVKS